MSQSHVFSNLVLALDRARVGRALSADEARLQSVVNYAHSQGVFVRFYTLNGYSESESQGWSAGYNFGTLQAARERWQAAIRVGADLIATDQCEQLAPLLRSRK